MSILSDFTGAKLIFCNFFYKNVSPFGCCRSAKLKVCTHQPGVPNFQFMNFYEQI